MNCPCNLVLNEDVATGACKRRSTSFPDDAAKTYLFSIPRVLIRLQRGKTSASGRVDARMRTE